MHPKGPADLMLSRDEMADVMLAFLWFQEALSVVMSKWDPIFLDIGLDDEGLELEF